MSKATVPTDCTWTAASLIKALEGVPGDTILVFGSSTNSAPAAKAASGTCWCGCGLPTAKKFAPGHDARFHGLAKKVARGQAAPPESFVNDEAEADFIKWIDRTLAEDRMKQTVTPITLISPSTRPAAVIKTVEPIDEPAEGADAETLIATMEALGE